MAENWKKVAPQLAKDLKNASKTLRKRELKSAKRGVDVARQRAPVRTGFLRANITELIETRRIVIQFPDQYASVEFGNSRGVTGVGFAAAGLKELGEVLEEGVLDDLEAIALGRI